MKYTAIIAYNIPSYAHIEFDAPNDAAAIAFAKKAAHDCDGDYNDSLEDADDHRVCSVENEAGETLSGSEGIYV